MSETNRLGRQGERLAAEYMEHKGYETVQCNYHGTHGEIDIICKNIERVVFVEVKTRRIKSSMYSRPASAIDAKKRAHILDAVSEYLREHPTELRVRIDVIEVYVCDGDPSFVHIENAIGN